MSQTLYLFLPGLVEQARKTEHFPQDSTLAFLLSRASHQFDASYHNRIKQLFSGLNEGPIPAGALGAYYYDLIKDSTWWCRADPVEYQVDHQQAYIIGNAHLALEVEEQKALLEPLTDFLAQDNVWLSAPHSREWFCSLSDHANVLMSDLLDVLGKNALHGLPAGVDQNYWRRLMTECQMLLAQNKVNQQRQITGKPLVSSLWFWGLGTLPSTVSSHFKHIYTNSSVMGGLAKCAQVDFQAIPLHYQAITSHTLLADNQFEIFVKSQFLEKGADYLLHYEQNWFKPLLQALKKGTLTSLIIDSVESGQFLITKKHLRAFWRRAKPFAHFV